MYTWDSGSQKQEVQEGFPQEGGLEDRWVVLAEDRTTSHGVLVSGRSKAEGMEVGVDGGGGCGARQVASRVGEERSGLEGRFRAPWNPFFADSGQGQATHSLV